MKNIIFFFIFAFSFLFSFNSAFAAPSNEVEVFWPGTEVRYRAFDSVVQFQTTALGKIQVVWKMGEYPFIFAPFSESEKGLYDVDFATETLVVKGKTLRMAPLSYGYFIDLIETNGGGVFVFLTTREGGKIYQIVVNKEKIDLKLVKKIDGWFGERLDNYITLSAVGGRNRFKGLLRWNNDGEFEEFFCNTKKTGVQEIKFTKKGNVSLYHRNKERNTYFMVAEKKCKH